MSAFDGELGDFFAAISEAHAKCFTWSPMMESPDVNAASVADASRPGGTVVGVFYDKEAKPAIPNAFDPRTDLRPGAIAGMPRIELIPSCDAPAPAVQRLDILVSEAGARWRVFSVFTTKTGVKICALNALG